MDCIYNKKSIERKINFMKRVGAECIFCDRTLAYDIYGKELYKVESPVKIFESIGAFILDEAPAAIIIIESVMNILFFKYKTYVIILNN